jgi:hypothetical protein
MHIFIVDRITGLMVKMGAARRPLYIGLFTGLRVETELVSCLS